MNNAIPLLFPDLCFQSILMCEVKLLSHLAVGVEADSVSGKSYSLNLTANKRYLFISQTPYRVLSFLPVPQHSFRTPSFFFPLQQLYFFLFAPYFSQAFLLHHLSIYLGRAGSYVLGLWRDGKSASEDVPAINLRCRSALPWASSVNTLIQTEKSFHPSTHSTLPFTPWSCVLC